MLKQQMTKISLKSEQLSQEIRQNIKDRLTVDIEKMLQAKVMVNKVVKVIRIIVQHLENIQKHSRHSQFIVAIRL